MALTERPTAPVEVSALRRWRWAITAITVLATVIITAAVSTGCGRGSPPAGPPQHPVGQIPLPGDSSRFDYASLDAGRGLLFIAHLGASQVIEVDVRAHRVVRTINNLSQVHGVLVVPERHRVYATATGSDQMVALDEDTGAALGRARTGNYPDGLAYDPQNATVWTTNESGGSETIIDAATYQVRGTVDLGAEAGNVAYDPASRMMLVDVQAHNSLAVIDPATLTIVRQMPLPGCQHDHGLALAPADRLAFVACDNATLLSVDLTTWQVTGANKVGADPDVLAYDPMAHRLYVAAESGDVTTLDNHNRRLTVLAREHVGDDAHVVAVDPTTGHSYYPLPTGPRGGPTLVDKAAP
ncbi:MAG TPA: YncE family protein [Pseudonocardiaceae bacterium]|nr:YncE family protein [Pseudonocardiaceae bacterium]